MKAGHFSAKIPGQLSAEINKLDLISDHLGHRDRNTTRYYYARSKQKQASRVYQEHVLTIREEASRRLSRHGRKRRRSDLEAAE